MMAANHIGTLRIGISWSIVDGYGIGTYDELMIELARHHMTALPVLLDPPLKFTNAPSNGPLLGMYPPKDPAQFAAFVSVAVQRYGRGGSFWRANPTVPYYPVLAWQIWNEPNLKIFWGGAPDARAYASMLRLSYRAIKRVDRRATVVMAGEPYATQYSAASSFYTQLYKVGARGSFDVLALHDYAPSVQQATLRLRVVRGIMNKFHDRKTPIWVTEMGWSSAGPANPYRAGLYGQRNNLARFLNYWLRNRAKLRLGKVILYGWRDVNAQVVGTPDFWGYHVSLLSYGLQPKPALATVSAGARRLNR
jgi:hypothetical protein